MVRRVEFDRPWIESRLYTYYMYNVHVHVHYTIHVELIVRLDYIIYIMCNYCINALSLRSRVVHGYSRHPCSLMCPN